ncbi:MAG: hypothetical protein JXQ27_09030 [Acidobacteria bacterium]|nr:hypothetical protein [Acidobacteriota bacterium]
MSGNSGRCFWQTILLLGGAALLYVTWRQPDFRATRTRAEPVAPSPAWRGNPGNQVFHTVGCRYYDAPGCTTRFRRREDAIRAGYRACKVCNP